ncbi:MAG: cation transporter [Zoogloeaceae bacterium]|nr:cation transporter [Zoogloeaceae bacterium]
MSSPLRFIQLSIAAAVATIVLKMGAWWVTGSVGLLSDALESFVNLAGASFALWMITIARTPADEDHPFGHGKAEYFSSGFEGVLIFGAALAILATAVERFLNPQPLAKVDVGLVFSAISTVINFMAARTLFRAAKEHQSVALDGDARHLMTDVWTSVGVIGAVALVAVTGWLWLDPLIAAAVGLNILREGARLVYGATRGLMDQALPPEELAQARATLEGFAGEGITYANLRTRIAGHQRFLSVDIRVPGDWTVRTGHGWLDRIELALAQALPGLHVVTHLEPNDAAGPRRPQPPIQA